MKCHLNIKTVKFFVLQQEDIAEKHYFGEKRQSQNTNIYFL